jgi:RNA polymerase sigma-70 factor (ECF subfamily)
VLLLKVLRRYARTPDETRDLVQRAFLQAFEAARRAVLSLPRRQREVFTLRIDGGLSFAEVAAALGITEGNAKTHFHHALKRLKEEVKR